MLYTVENHTTAYYSINFGVFGVFQREKMAKNSQKQPKMIESYPKIDIIYLLNTLVDPAHFQSLWFVVYTWKSRPCILFNQFVGVWSLPRGILAKNSLKLSKISPELIEFSYWLLYFTQDSSSGYDLLYTVENHTPSYYSIGFGVSRVFQREKIAKK